MIHYYVNGELCSTTNVICAACYDPRNNWKFGFQDGEKRTVCCNLLIEFLESDLIDEMYDENNEEYLN